MEDRAIVLEGVATTYEGERTATLRGIALEVDRGEHVAIVGPNGAGKTTLLEVIDGLLPVTEGTVQVLGEAMGLRSHRLRRRIGYLPQDLAFPSDTPFLAADVVLMGRFGQIGPLRFPGEEDRAAAVEAIDSVGIRGIVRRPIGRLSGGQQRKVLLAHLLARGPELLLLDEPTANLDPAAKEEIARLVLQLHRDRRLTTLVVSHEPSPLLEADRVLCMEGGRIARDERPGGAQGGR